jgi:hypothetical protein
MAETQYFRYVTEIAIKADATEESLTPSCENANSREKRQILPRPVFSSE